MSGESAKRLLFGLATVGLVAVLPAASAAAATSTATFTVTLNLAATCNVTADNLDFGAYSGALVTSAATVRTTCSTGTPFTLGLDQGASAGATVTTRRMTGPGGEQLNYGLFQDAAHSLTWGNTPGSDTRAGLGAGVAQTFTVFGRIPASQAVRPGSYSDTITVTLTF